LKPEVQAVMFYRQACPASAFTPSKQLPAGIIFELQAL
jgi:hypothetical protein